MGKEFVGDDGGVGFDFDEVDSWKGRQILLIDALTRELYAPSLPAYIPTVGTSAIIIRRKELANLFIPG